MAKRLALDHSTPLVGVPESLNADGHGSESGQTGFASPPDDEIVSAALSVFRGTEFRHYHQYEDQIIDALGKRIPTIRSSVAPALADRDKQRYVAEIAAQSLKHAERTYRVILAVSIPFLSAVALISLLHLLYRPTLFLRLPGTTSANASSAVDWAYLLTAVLCIAVVLRIGRRSLEMFPVAARAREAERAAYSTESTYRETLSSLCASELRLAISDALGGTEALVFPSEAPALVELETSQVVPFDSLRLVERIY